MLIPRLLSLLFLVSGRSLSVEGPSLVVSVVAAPPKERKRGDWAVPSTSQWLRFEWNKKENPFSSFSLFSFLFSPPSRASNPGSGMCQGASDSLSDARS